ncbi:hypothetical protein [Nocardia seriolae]|uniref:hypothetical protein n=1 Tax=Nocardia seriolae TaxID=37332 RepID=UPI0018AD1D3C|nr:hypothetical protein [Nocardia seriolae]
MEVLLELGDRDGHDGHVENRHDGAAHHDTGDLEDAYVQFVVGGAGRRGIRRSGHRFSLPAGW